MKLSDDDFLEAIELDSKWYNLATIKTALDALEKDDPEDDIKEMIKNVKKAMNKMDDTYTYTLRDDTLTLDGDEFTRKK
jgi:hypothetical protein